MLLVINVPSKSLLSVRGMKGSVSSDKSYARKIKSTYLFVLLSILMLCAEKRKYCAGVLGQLRGRAAAQLRGNVAGMVIFLYKSEHTMSVDVVVR